MITPSIRRPLRAAAVVLAVAAALAGCESTKLTDTATGVPVESRGATASSGAGGAGATAGSASQSGVTTVDLGRTGAGAGAAGGTAMMAAPSQRVVYFDFDSYVIKDQYKNVIEGHARSLAGSRDKRVVVEGHTDERGGSEYNLALGQKRAEAVVRSLELLGASPQQLEAVSFGEERPAATGHDESAWERNRRAELRDR